MIALGLDKASPKSSGKMEAADEADEKDEGDEVDSYAQDAWDAIQDDDAESFKLAFKGALECMTR
jgi:hypothetical protein